MTNRRSLTEGLKATPAVDPAIEQAFVYNKPLPKTWEEGTPAPPVAKPAATSNAQAARSPISTRIRADMAAALKRASLERQLSGVEPNTLQDILEQAIEPWLKQHGYLT